MVAKRKQWGGRRPGAGRKPIPEAAKRQHAVFIRLDDAERAAIEAAAGHEPLASFMRRLVLRSLARRRR